MKQGVWIPILRRNHLNFSDLMLFCPFRSGSSSSWELFQHRDPIVVKLGPFRQQLRAEARLHPVQHAKIHFVVTPPFSTRMGDIVLSCLRVPCRKNAKIAASITAQE